MRSAPESAFSNFGEISRGDIGVQSGSALMDSSPPTHYQLRPFLPESGIVEDHDCANREHQKIPATRKDGEGERHGREVRDSFDPSRIPPRISPRRTPALPSIEREIDGVLISHPYEPPATIEISLSDRRRDAAHGRNRRWLWSATERACKKAGCAIGDAVPLNTTAVVAASTAHR